MTNLLKLKLLIASVVSGISACGQNETAPVSPEEALEEQVQSPVTTAPQYEPNDKHGPSPSNENPVRETEDVSPLTEASYTAAEVALHNTKADCWIIIGESVFNITGFFEDHPGGEAPVRFCGRNATTVFSRIHADSAGADFMAQQYRIGRLIL